MKMNVTYDNTLPRSYSLCVICQDLLRFFWPIESPVCTDYFCLQSKQRRKPTFREAQRRAQSEGPGIRNPLFRSAPDEPDIRPALPTFSRSTSARRVRVGSAQNKSHSSSNDTQVRVKKTNTFSLSLSFSYVIS